MTDARITCLTLEQLQLLAALHGRVLQTAGMPPGNSTPKPEETSQADLLARLAQVEAQVATLQTQLTDLAIQLLKERHSHHEQQQLAYHVQHTIVNESSFPSPLLAEPFQEAMPPFVCHPTEKRRPLIPLIEYGAKGCYVLISPEEGECSCPGLDASVKEGVRGRAK